MVKSRKERIEAAIRQRQLEDKARLRSTILIAANELLLEHGYDKFSMRQLAETIGYSATTLYNHFQDKDELLFSVLDEGFNIFTRQLNDAYASTDDPVQRIIAIGDAYIDFGLSQPEYYRLMFIERPDFLTNPRPDTKVPRHASFQIVLKSVEEALAAGHLRPGNAKLYSDYLWSVVHGIVALKLNFPFMDNDRLLQLKESLPLLVMNGLKQK